VQRVARSIFKPSQRNVGWYVPLGPGEQVPAEEPLAVTAEVADVELAVAGDELLLDEAIGLEEGLALDTKMPGDDGGMAFDKGQVNL
jgi:hypothetical protein